MINKIIAFAAAGLFSASASAGYIQYDLDYGTPGNGLSGVIVQHDTDQSIAYFSFHLSDSNGGYGQQFYPFTGDGTMRLTSASTYFRDSGPTNFTIHDNFGGDHDTALSVNFGLGEDGRFTYTAHYVADLWANFPPVVYSGTVSGLATPGTLDPLLASYLDELGGYDYGVPRIVPDYIGPHEVPEPASLALFAFAAAGLAGAVRRKRAA